VTQAISQPESRQTLQKQASGSATLAQDSCDFAPLKFLLHFVKALV